jgi:hypothetical protein
MRKLKLARKGKIANKTMANNLKLIEKYSKEENIFYRHMVTLTKNTVSAYA